MLKTMTKQKTGGFVTIESKNEFNDWTVTLQRRTTPNFYNAKLLKCDNCQVFKCARCIDTSNNRNEIPSSFFVLSDTWWS